MEGPIVISDQASELRLRPIRRAATHLRPRLRHCTQVPQCGWNGQSRQRQNWWSDIRRGAICWRWWIERFSGASCEGEFPRDSALRVTRLSLRPGAGQKGRLGVLGLSAVWLVRHPARTAVEEGQRSAGSSRAQGDLLQEQVYVQIELKSNENSTYFTAGKHYSVVPKDLYSIVLYIGQLKYETEPDYA